MNKSSSKLLTSERGLTARGLEKSGNAPNLTSFPPGFCCSWREWPGGLRWLRNASAAVSVACSPDGRFAAFCAPATGRVSVFSVTMPSRPDTAPRTIAAYLSLSKTIFSMGRVSGLRIRRRSAVQRIPKLTSRILFSFVFGSPVAAVTPKSSPAGLPKPGWLQYPLGRVAGLSGFQRFLDSLSLLLAVCLVSPGCL